MFVSYEMMAPNIGFHFSISPRVSQKRSVTVERAAQMWKAWRKMHLRPMRGAFANPDYIPLVEKLSTQMTRRGDDGFELVIDVRQLSGC
jgi:hypothetical protein